MPGDEKIAGYFSLSSDGVRLTTFEMGELGLNFEVELSFFPAVKITRFAISGKYQRAGLGLHLIKTIEGIAYTDYVAARVLTVDAFNAEDVLNFYRKAQFKECLNSAKRRGSQRPETIHMYKDIYAPEVAVRG